MWAQLLVRIEEQERLVKEALCKLWLKIKGYEGKEMLEEQTTWEGFELLHDSFNGDNVIVAVPKTPAKGNPWVWRTEFFGAFAYADKAMLEKGWHIVTLCISDLFGAPIAVRKMDGFHDYITKKHSLNLKAVLFGFSRGGLYAYNYAAAFPKRISAIYLDAPVIDIKSWPGGFFKGIGSPRDWEMCKEVYGYTDETADEYDNSIALAMQTLINEKIPMIIVAGGKDEVVPFEENGRIFANGYENADVAFELIMKPECGHHPHSLENPAPITDFILDNS